MIWVIIIGFMILSFVVSRRLKSKFRKYAQIPLRSGMSGAEIAHKMLRDNRIFDVQVVSTPGDLTDHYNPATKTVNLSEGVYHGRNAAAAAVAAHECGHAVQHATAYSFLKLRSALVPIQNASSKILNFIFIVSFGSALFFGSSFLPWDTTLLIIIGAYSAITLFTLITLPVEFDASRRALAWIDRERVVTREEHAMSKDALKWAAMTYVIAALSSITMLFYYVLQYMGMDD
ncbi:zinc metallopeptidase [Flammeovirgaceae bacterium SG7u.111]|nr:zinc metallopeptidase [Flammeovirgaceae bacterium SG7u.132]WPO34389.1 zinc metallopeptidase [Flammeovirgaceae bacterium SG7u.111]